MKISCCMIVKNEAEHIGETLKLARGHFDEIVVVDTGSGDRTWGIAAKYADVMEKYTWTGDFSSARNYSIEMAKNDWIFILDADESILSFEVEKVNTSIRSETDIGNVLRRNSMNSGLIYNERIKRLFNRENYRYEGIIHEQLMPVTNNSGRSIDLDIVLDHIGYKNEVLRRTDKVSRNIALLQKAIKDKPLDPYLYYQLAKSYSLAKRPEQAKGYFERALGLVDNFSFDYVEDLVESYGYTLLDLKQYPQALCMEQYVDIYGYKADFCFLMGLVSMNNALFDKAVMWFETCLDKPPGRVEGVNTFLPAFNLGILFECLGYTDEAVRRYQWAKGYKPAEERIRLLKIGIGK